MGDVFFMVGSVVDVILCDLHFDDGVCGWAVFSSLLWCLDACLYLWSDSVFKRELLNEKARFLCNLETSGDVYTIVSDGGSKIDSHLMADRKSTRLNSSHRNTSRMPSSA